MEYLNDIEKLQETVSKNIKIRRKEIGMTMEELAEKVGYKSKASISYIEKGKTDLSTQKVMDFAAALNTTPAYLLGIDEELEEYTPSKLKKPDEPLEQISVDEQALLVYYRSLNESGKSWVRQCAEMASKAKEYTN